MSLKTLQELLVKLRINPEALAVAYKAPWLMKALHLSTSAAHTRSSLLASLCVEQSKHTVLCLCARPSLCLEGSSTRCVHGFLHSFLLTLSEEAFSDELIK